MPEIHTSLRKMKKGRIDILFPHKYDLFKTHITNHENAFARKCTVISKYNKQPRRLIVLWYIKTSEIYINVGYILTIVFISKTINWDLDM